MMRRYGAGRGLALLLLLLLGGCQNPFSTQTSMQAAAPAHQTPQTSGETGASNIQDSDMQSSGMQSSDVKDSNNQDSAMHDSSMHDSGMHEGEGKLPPGLTAAKNPAYPVGSKVMLKAGHMEGMNGAEAVITGAYNTTAYVVTYEPVTGGKPVHNHKWVVQEEIKEAGRSVLKPGTQVVLEADHMKGMQGASGIIESSETTTVYMVDYKPTTGGPVVKNHKWVVESELSPANSK